MISKLLFRLLIKIKMNAAVLNLMIAGAMPSASTQMAHIPAAVRLVTVAMALTVQVKSCFLRHLP